MANCRKSLLRYQPFQLHSKTEMKRIATMRSKLLIKLATSSSLAAVPPAGLKLLPQIVFSGYRIITFCI